jgi:rhodanese-related sulfurtransferase
VNKLSVAVAILFVLASAGRASALSPEEARIIQQAAARYLESTPENNFLVSPAEVLARIQSGKADYLLVDVRTAKEFKLWHLPGAINIPNREIATPESIAKLPRDKELIVYCNSGHESSKVLSVLRILEFRALGMKWGVMAWRPVPATAATLKAIAEGTTATLPIEQ